MSPRNQEVMRTAELAMGSSARVMEDYSFQRRLGWDVYWTPEVPVSLATKNPIIKSLIWC